MENNFKDVKVSVQSILTSSKTPLSIEQLQKDYRDLEGSNLPYRRLGFTSVVQLLQKMDDVLILPSNPNNLSIISLVVSDKTSHIRELIVKQKSNVKGRKVNSSLNTRNRNYTNKNINRPVLRNNFNKDQSNLSRNIGKTYRESQIENRVCHQGYVTKELRLFIEKNIKNNKMLITIDKFKELVKNHPDCTALKARCFQDVKDLFKDFLIVNETGVSLKNICQLTTNKHNSPVHNKELKKSENLDDEPCNKNKNSFTDDKIFYKMDEPAKMSSGCLVEVHKNQNTSAKTQDIYSSCDENKNIDVAKTNIEYIKRQPDLNNKKYIEPAVLNGIKTSSPSHKLIDLNAECTPTQNIHNFNEKCVSSIENAEISLNENQSIPNEILLNIARIFKVYCKGVNIENYLLIYYKMYYTYFDSTVYGFTSTINMLQVLDQMIEIRNNVLYTKNKFAYSKKYEDISLKNDKTFMIQKIVLHHASLSHALEISLNVDEAVVDDYSKMVLAEVYNPSAFYLQLAHRNVELERLTKQMQLFYDKEKIKYHVQSEQILLGSVYATSFSLNLQKGLWYRVRVLKEINSTTTNVIFVDYGTIKEVPKTELRFLKYEFCELPCQAVHCCLTGYNEFEAFESEVTQDFLNIVNNKPVIVQIDDKFILDPQCQILHVTLFKSLSSKCSINDELTIKLK